MRKTDFKQNITYLKCKLASYINKEMLRDVKETNIHLFFFFWMFYKRESPGFKYLPQFVFKLFSKLTNTVSSKDIIELNFKENIKRYFLSTGSYHWCNIWLTWDQKRKHAIRKNIWKAFVCYSYQFLHRDSEVYSYTK